MRSNPRKSSTNARLTQCCRYPQGIFVEGMETSASPATPAEQTEDDFFDSWSKPATPKTSAPGTPRTLTPPVVGRTTSSSSTSSQPRTITSSAASRAAKLGASRLNSASSVSTIPKKSKLGLGASKAKPVNFEEAERKALEEAERIKQLGYDRQREEEEEKARKAQEAAKAALEIGPKKTVAATSATPVNKAAAPTPTYPRFGFGAIPGAAAAAAATATVVRSAPSPYVHWRP